LGSDAQVPAPQLASPAAGFFFGAVAVEPFGGCFFTAAVAVVAAVATGVAVAVGVVPEAASAAGLVGVVAAGTVVGVAAPAVAGLAPHPFAEHDAFPAGAVVAGVTSLACTG
jgi:hypothetical protein